MTSIATRARDIAGFNASDLARLTEIAALEAEFSDRTATFPELTLRRLFEEGVFDAIFAEGEQALDVIAQARLIQAVAEGDPTAALALVNTIHAVEKQKALGIWPAEVLAEFQRRAAKGPVLINSARAEPELGAPARGGIPHTRADRSAGGWVVNGRKSYVTGSRHLDWHSVWVTTDESPLRVGHILVPGDHPGIEIVETWDHLGLRASATHDVIYRGVEVPFENFIEIPFVDGRYVDPVGRGGPSSLLHVVIYVGVARAAQRAFHEFARSRVPSALGRPISETERIQAVAGEIEGLLVQAEELLYGLTARAQTGDAEAIQRTQIAKPVIARTAIQAVETAVAALGNPALSRSNSLERHLRDVLCARVHPPQEDAARVATGRRLLSTDENGLNHG
jgi:alkylation response protein AidB-like acyl-CoA dehydrogenase